MDISMLISEKDCAIFHRQEKYITTYVTKISHHMDTTSVDTNLSYGDTTGYK